MRVKEINDLLEKAHKTLKKYFAVIEDNGGGLTLVVYNEDDYNVDYVHTGYEHHLGSLVKDLQRMANGEDPVKDFDNNVENPEEIADNLADALGDGCEVIADIEGICIKAMGVAGRKEFGIEEE